MPPESILSVPCGGANTPLWPHHASWRVPCCSWGRPTGHMTGDFHCKEGRQEVEWKPGLSTVSLNIQPTARPSHCQQAQLGQALRWPIVQWGLHVFTAVGVSLWPPEGVQRGNRTDQRRARYFYHHIGQSVFMQTEIPQRCGKSTWTQCGEGRWWNSWPVHVKSYQRRIRATIKFPNLGLQIHK